MNTPDDSPPPAQAGAVVGPEGVPHRAENDALVEILFTQSRLGVLLFDPDLRLLRSGPHPAGPAPLPPDDPVPERAARGRRAGDRHDGAGAADPLAGARPADLFVPQDAARIEERLREAITTGTAFHDLVIRARPAGRPDRDRVVAMSALPVMAGGVCRSLAVLLTDVTEEEWFAQRARLVGRAAATLGIPVDIDGNAEAVAAVMVPAFADLAAVDVVETAVVGDELGDLAKGTPLRRIAVASAHGPWPDALPARGSVIQATEEEKGRLLDGPPRFATDPPPAEDPETAVRALLRRVPGAGSCMVVPLRARGQVAGSLTLWRGRERAPFEARDAELLEIIASRAGLALDNARRFTREQRTAETLQRSLLPHRVRTVTGAESVGIYVPGRTPARTGGRWYDVVPLSATRVAFVVGRVMGHGPTAAAATGRLRTAVRTLADLDPAPDELMTHLDDLVLRIAAEQDPADPDGLVEGATCLYCVYDPTTGRCSMASAGHPPPVSLRPGGEVRTVALTPGPALGLGGSPFEPVELPTDDGDLLVLASASLDGDAAGAVPVGPLLDAAKAHDLADGGLQALGHAMVRALLSDTAGDDAALLLTRLRRTPTGSVRGWEYPADEEVVARSRADVTAELTAWGLDDLVFTTQLIVSELVTNSIRYAGAPIRVRLIKDEYLICEVSDPSQTQPHLRRARLSDEGGRGLYLVAQLTHRWGSRYTADGKTIWTEQRLPGPGHAPG
ncbi:SpoIIE family protein phosphatase [Kitasatospora sp. NPDC059327]|uniref:SpoIIE family protein phosphatase n=1 Tax=Kitasatospora sp. NPDC059327 TaxID=3346803 RepID=UPI00368E9BCA